MAYLPSWPGYIDILDRNQVYLPCDIHNVPVDFRVKNFSTIVLHCRLIVSCHQNVVTRSPKFFSIDPQQEKVVSAEIMHHFGRSTDDSECIGVVFVSDEDQTGECSEWLHNLTRYRKHTLTFSIGFIAKTAHESKPVNGLSGGAGGSTGGGPTGGGAATHVSKKKRRNKGKATHADQSTKKHPAGSKPGRTGPKTRGLFRCPSSDCESHLLMLSYDEVSLCNHVEKEHKIGGRDGKLSDFDLKLVCDDGQCKLPLGHRKTVKNHRDMCSSQLRLYQITTGWMIPLLCHSSDQRNPDAIDTTLTSPLAHLALSEE